MDLKIFSQLDFLPALQSFFEKLNVPINHVADEPTTAKETLKDTYKDNEAFNLTNEVYFVGMVDDASFKNKESATELNKIKSNYDGILVFGITLHDRPNGLLPTRSQLAEISRAFNREFYYTPVVIVFKYNNHIAFANTERLKYKQEWREGEKAGKVSLLRDVNIQQPHAGHHRILAELEIPTSGKDKVDSFAKLYTYWQEVLSVNILNKKFYNDLSNWYFWAVKNVQFPGAPTFEEAHTKKVELSDLLQQHRATNVIRMLTRLLFVWFLKEKKLIPDELFDLKTLQQDILNEIEPTNQNGLFKQQNIDSVYYKAILQNLFFATLNCPIEGDSMDKRKRGFRLSERNFGAMFLMRYEKYFKDKDSFLKMVNETVPFLNGGLFECLDERGTGEQKDERIWIDGFSDNLPKEQQLVVPDYLFFGVEEQTDLSDIVGVTTKQYKQAGVKGLIRILESYKFTITENTPIEEDVALDPELLGKVFENLLASYNPETKTTARKQTGSFYTPREIVNYMVDESLIAYLNNVIEASSFEKATTDQDATETLRQLVSFDPLNPFSEDKKLTKDIITALSTCTILDPACGSGAFPMGILQKMVHILQKLDPSNEIWLQVQFDKADAESKDLFGHVEDEKARQQRLDEIYDAFDQTVNDPDYARKLFLIENCIFGVDIQPIATQISKLRFFISLVVEQKVNPEKENFGIRPLPNLETKFVTANTLIGIDRPKGGDQLEMFNTEKLKVLENELKTVRSKLFSAKTRDTKVKYRNRDEELRDEIATELLDNGWETDTAQKLAGWDPYDQNASSSFFDPEWMFDIKEGFDVVIANPPYIGEKGNKEIFNLVERTEFGKKFHLGRMDYYYFFYHMALDLAKKDIGIISFITTNYFVTAHGAHKLRQDIKERSNILKIVNFNELKVFESAAGQHNMICILCLNPNTKVETIITNSNRKGLANSTVLKHILSNSDVKTNYYSIPKELLFEGEENYIRVTGIDGEHDLNHILNKIKESGTQLDNICNVNNGLRSGIDRIKKEDKGVFILSTEEAERIFGNELETVIKPYYKNSDIQKYKTSITTDKLVVYTSRNTRIGDFPKTKAHLSFLKQHIEKKRWKESIPWFALVRSRNEDIFTSEKIVSPQRSTTNTFGYSDSEWYGGSDIFYITKKHPESINLKYLLGVLNSKLFYLWLYHKGKRKGEMLELIGTPLKEIPIISNPHTNMEATIAFISSILIFESSIKQRLFQTIIDALVFELYFEDHMKERSIDVLEFVERDIENVLT